MHVLAVVVTMNLTFGFGFIGSVNNTSNSNGCHGIAMAVGEEVTIMPKMTIGVEVSASQVNQKSTSKKAPWLLSKLLKV